VEEAADMSDHVHSLWVQAHAASDPEEADEALQAIWDLALHQGTLRGDAPLVLRLFLGDLRQRGLDLGTLWGIECALGAATKDNNPTIAAEVLSEIRGAKEDLLGLLQRPCPDESREPCDVHYLAARIALQVGGHPRTVAGFLRANPTRHRGIWMLIPDFQGMSELSLDDLRACLTDGPTDAASVAAFWLAAKGVPEGSSLASSLAHVNGFKPTLHHAEAVAHFPTAFDIELIKQLFQSAWDLGTIESLMASLLRRVTRDVRLGWQRAVSTSAKGRLIVLHPDVAECLEPSPGHEVDMAPWLQLLRAKSRLKLIDTDSWRLFGIPETGVAGTGVTLH
jgi:hypothetical protein